MEKRYEEKSDFDARADDNDIDERVGAEGSETDADGRGAVGTARRTEGQCGDKGGV